MIAKQQLSYSKSRAVRARVYEGMSVVCLVESEVTRLIAVSLLPHPVNDLSRLIGCLVSCRKKCSRSHDRKRSRSRDRRESRGRDHKRSHSRDKRRSHSREHRSSRESGGQHRDQHKRWVPRMALPVCAAHGNVSWYLLLVIYDPATGLLVVKIRHFISLFD